MSSFHPPSNPVSRCCYYFRFRGRETEAQRLTVSMVEMAHENHVFYNLLAKLPRPWLALENGSAVPLGSLDWTPMLSVQGPGGLPVLSVSLIEMFIEVNCGENRVHSLKVMHHSC